MALFCVSLFTDSTHTHHHTPCINLPSSVAFSLSDLLRSCKRLFINLCFSTCFLTHTLLCGGPINVFCRVPLALLHNVLSYRQCVSPVPSSNPSSKFTVWHSLSHSVTCCHSVTLSLPCRTNLKSRLATYPSINRVTLCVLSGKSIATCVCQCPGVAAILVPV